MSPYVLAPEARTDLREIRDFYVAEAGTEVARGVLTELRTAFRFLVENRHVGHTRQDLTHREVRFWPVRAYLVVYWPEADPIEIIAVLHGSRDVERVLVGR